MTARSGAVSAKLLEDPGAPEVQLGPDEEFVPAQLVSDNSPPIYPREFLARNIQPHVVTVRVTFDELGRVLTVSGSPVGASTESPYASHFLAAVHEAVKSWHCSPARIRKFRDGPDADGDGKADYRIMTAQEMLKTFFDLSFAFDVVNGHPVVRSVR